MFICKIVGKFVSHGLETYDETSSTFSKLFICKIVVKFASHGLSMSITNVRMGEDHHTILEESNNTTLHERRK